MTIPSLSTIPRALKLGKKIDLKKMLNWAKKGANLEASLVLGQLMILILAGRSQWSDLSEKVILNDQNLFSGQILVSHLNEQLTFSEFSFLIPYNIE